MIFRKLDYEDKIKIEALCSKRKIYNFFILSNLHILNQKQELIAYYGLFDQQELVAIMMFFHKLVYYEIKDHAYFSVLMSHLEALDQQEVILNDTYDLYQSDDLIGKYQEVYNRKGGLYVYQNTRKYTQTHNVYQATGHDIDDLIVFYQDAADDVKRGKDSLSRSVGSGRRTFFTKEKSKITASVLTTGETEDMAMIGGIHYLNDDALTSTTLVITESLVKDGKSIYTVLRNERLIGIYKNLGFLKLGNWNMFYLRKNK